MVCKGQITAGSGRVRRALAATGDRGQVTGEEIGGVREGVDRYLIRGTAAGQPEKDVEANACVEESECVKNNNRACENTVARAVL